MRANENEAFNKKPFVVNLGNPASGGSQLLGFTANGFWLMPLTTMNDNDVAQVTKRRNVARRPAAHQERQVRAYKFNAQLVAPLPAWVMPMAETMKSAWNDLAFPLKRALREAEQAEAAAQTAGDDATAVTTEEPLKVNYKGAAVRPFKDTANVRKIVRARCKGLIPSDCYEGVLVAKWQTAIGEWPARRKRAKEEAGRPVSFETGMPRPQRELEKFQFAVVLATAAAAPISFEAFFEGVHGVQVFRTPQADGANVSFCVRQPGKEKLAPLRLRAALHRLPPSDAYVKRVTLSARKDARGAWQWAIIFTVREEKRGLRQLTGVVAGHNAIGWRAFEDRIRVGVIADSGGYFYEIAMPVITAGRAARKDREWVEAKLGRSYDKPLSYHDAEALQARIGAGVEQCKSALRLHYAAEGSLWPEEARRSYLGLMKMREGGLRRLRELLKGAQTEAEVTLSLWDEDNAPLQRKLTAFHERTLRMRQDVWRKVSAWVGVSFDEYGMTAGSLQKLAKAKDQPHGVKASQVNRQNVGQFYLRGWIAQQIAKRNPWDVSAAGELSAKKPVEIKEAYTCECGAAVARHGKLDVTCGNGHLRDQDVVAAAFVLKQLGGVAGMSREPLAIPVDLRRYLRVMTASEVATRVI